MQYKITKLVLKHGRVQVFINDNYAFSCTETFLAYNRLYVDLEFEENELEVIKQKAHYSIVEFKLFEYANRSRYSRKELVRKTVQYCKNKFNFVPETKFLDEAVAKASNLRLFAEENSAHNMTQMYVSRGKSQKYIQFQLQSKGFEKTVIQNAVSTINKEIIENSLKLQLERKLESLRKGEALSYYDTKQKLLTYFVRKGFGYREVQNNIQEIFEKKNISKNS